MVCLFIVLFLILFIYIVEIILETNGVTTLVYQRKLVTGDSADYPITSSGMYLLWSIGSDDGTYVPSNQDWTFSQHITVSI